MITLALACGIFTAASAAKNEKPWANGKLQVSANQRFLQFENGQPFFMLGDTGWLLPERLDRAEAQYYLQKCRVAGFNTVLIQGQFDRFQQSPSRRPVFFRLHECTHS